MRGRLMQELSASALRLHDTYEKYNLGTVLVLVLAHDTYEKYNLGTVLPGLKESIRRVGRSQCVLILDPPRRGIPPSVIQALSTHPPRQIFYVSCAPDSLARDIARLVNLGYRVEHAQLFDLFPRTASFESLTALRRP